MAGNIAPYMTSYFADATQTGPQTIFSLTLFFTVLGNFPGTYLLKSKIVAPRVILLIGGSLCISAFVICSFFEKFSLFEYIYPGLLGFGSGFIF